MSDCPAFLLKGRQSLTGLKSELTFGARLLVRGRGHGPSSPLTSCRGHPEDPPLPLVRAFQPLAGSRLPASRRGPVWSKRHTFKLKSSAGIKAKRQPSSADLQQSLGQSQTITRNTQISASNSPRTKSCLIWSRGGVLTESSLLCLDMGQSQS